MGLSDKINFLHYKKIVNKSIPIVQSWDAIAIPVGQVVFGETRLAYCASYRKPIIPDTVCPFDNEATIKVEEINKILNDSADFLNDFDPFNIACEPVSPFDFENEREQIQRPPAEPHWEHYFKELPTECQTLITKISSATTELDLEKEAFLVAPWKILIGAFIVLCSLLLPFSIDVGNTLALSFSWSILIFFGYALFFDNLKRARLQAKGQYEGVKKQFSADLDEWHKCVELYETKLREYDNAYAQSRSTLERARAAYLKKLETEKMQYKKLLDDYANGSPRAVEAIASSVINYSPYPNYLIKNFDLEYHQESKILIVDFQFPDFTDKLFFHGPTGTRKLAGRRRTEAIETIVFGMAIRTACEVAHFDKGHFFDAIAFNGWAKCIDKSTGQKRDGYFLSLLARKQQILDINIQHISPKHCFLSLKGRVNAKVDDYVPIAPIVSLDQNDKRLVESREILAHLDTQANLASMEWLDFEHLIRELLEKEFTSIGANVRVTQSSRDRGVDAIIFDPDPIKGGKMVVQAKRYTNIVDVSAVRDLYGTVINEGATKGILVTTTNYGSDSFEFAKDKPITLLTGNHLLHLLKKHGYEFKIDVAEAKRLLGGR